MNKSAEQRLRDILDQYVAEHHISEIWCYDYGKAEDERDFIEVEVKMADAMKLLDVQADGSRRYTAYWGMIYVEMYPMRDLIYRSWNIATVKGKRVTWDKAPKHLVETRTYETTTVPSADIVKAEAGRLKSLGLYRYRSRDPDEDRGGDDPVWLT